MSKLTDADIQYLAQIVDWLSHKPQLNAAEQKCLAFLSGVLAKPARERRYHGARR